MTEISDPIRSVLQSYLEVLYLACDLNSQWTAKDLHAAFEWALTLHKLASDPLKLSLIASNAEKLRPSLPHIIQNTLDEAIKSPTEVLLRRLLVHNSNTAASGRIVRPDWVLKVLAAHTSACSLPDPSLSSDVHNALARIRENQSCATLLQAALKDAALVASPSASAVQKLAMAAPSWLPFPATIASEYLKYFSKESALELAAAATLLRQQQERRIKATSNEQAANAEGDETTEPAVHAELLAMALCLPLSSHCNSEQIINVADSHQAEKNPEAEEEIELLPSKSENQRALNRKKLLQRLPEDPLAQELCSLLHSIPSLAVSLPAPLLSRACRSSFSLSLEYAAALKKLRDDQNSNYPVTAVISALKHVCLFNDATALLFKDDLDSVYRSI